MGSFMGVAFLIIGNVTLLIYDRLLAVMTQLYINKLRNKLIR